MAYDEGLAQRIREHFADRPDVNEKKMFGGLCFMVSKHMCCGVVGDTLMARVGADSYNKCLQLKHAKKMDFTGTPMRGFISVNPAGIQEDEDLLFWVNKCVAYVASLPVR